MVNYIIKRILYSILLIGIMTFIAYGIIELPPGDYLTTRIEELESQGASIGDAEIDSLRRQFGLDLPVYARYFKWVTGFFTGRLGRSMALNRPINELIGTRLSWTITISSITLVFTYMIAFPIGVYSAVHQYSIGDHMATAFGFFGIATPSFLLALVLMYLAYKTFGFNPSGLFSPEYKIAPWSTARFLDMLKHLPIPIVVIGLAGTAGIIRVMRGSLLDELKKQYVITARAKGLTERSVLLNYPVRVAVNPLISTIGWALPGIFSGAAVTAIVLDLPTIGNLLYTSLLSQDTYLAGTIIMILAILTVIGTLISDILLVVVDPRIRFEKSDK